jgi:WD40 repeat protein
MNGVVRIRDAVTGEPIGTPLIGSTERASKMTFSPDGKLLTRLDDGATARIWEIEPHQDPLAYLCGRAGGLSPDKWRTHVSEESTSRRAKRTRVSISEVVPKTGIHLS